jgi:hypothetical protein
MAAARAFALQCLARPVNAACSLLGRFPYGSPTPFALEESFSSFA